MTAPPPVRHRDQVWPVIVAERLRLAGLLDDLSDSDWERPSLCDGWTVRDVAAHLTLQQLGARAALAMMIAYRGDTDRAIAESARKRAAAWPAARIAAEIRDTAEARRHNVGVTALETLIDVLVHAQDIAIPLGREYPMPEEAAAAAASRLWTMRWPPPFPAVRTLREFTVSACDADWTAGEGPPVKAPISAIVLLSAGRLAALPAAYGDGAAELAARFTARPGTGP